MHIKFDTTYLIDTCRLTYNMIVNIKYPSMLPFSKPMIGKRFVGERWHNNFFLLLYETNE